MKKNLFITALLTLALAIQTNAQFVRNLKEMAVGRSKEVIHQKTNEKVTEKTADGMDKILNPDLPGLVSNNESYEEYENLESTYRFTFHYRMKTAAGGKPNFTDYLLNPGSNYYGISAGEETDKLTIFETDHFFTFSGKNKSVKSSKPDIPGKKEDDTFNFRNSASVNELPVKIIMGAACPGYQIRTPEKTLEYYILPGAGVTIPPTMLQNLYSGIPKAILQQLTTETRGLIVSIELKNEKNDRIFLMECTELNPIEYDFDTEGYTIK